MHGDKVCLDLQQRDHALGEIVVFFHTGAVHLVDAIVKLAAVAGAAGLADDEMAAFVLPVGRGTGSEFGCVRVQSQFGVGKDRFNRFAVAFLQRGPDYPQLAFREVFDCAHNPCAGLCLVVARRRGAMQGRQILAQNLIYFMSFVDFYHAQGVA